MKRFAKRSLAMLLALVLSLSMFVGVAPKAEAATYTYNWGTREDTATSADFTRSTAEEWYAAEGTSYEELTQLSGSKTQSAVPSSALYLELKSLMTNAHTTKTSYDGTKSMYQYTDCQNGGGKISSFYSGNAIGPAWGQGDWNREHTWPKSKSLNGNSNGGQDETDIMMLRPTSTSENSSRGNTAYGESYYDPNDESGGKYNLHGDVARIVLYVYVRWGNTQYMWGSSGVMESRATLLKWMEEDPVDTWELGRNDSVESITGTRNVFVDYPELGFLLFGEEVPAGYETPSGSGNLTSYSITATSNNTAYGTVTLSGKTITATPKTGYYAAGYTVTSGTAQVIQNGNTFQVIASSDCTVRINFAAKTSVQVKFSENGSIAKTVSAYGGDSLTLPALTNAAPEGCTFLGWMESALSDTTQKPTFLAAGTTVTAANKTYYALYTYAVGGTGEIGYTLTDIGSIKPGDAFVITMTKGTTVYALPNAAASTGPTPATVTAADGKLTGDIAANLLWNLGGSSGAWEFYPNGETSRWLCCISDNNGVRVGTEDNKTFKISGTYLYNIGTGRYLGVYENKPDWRCYTSSSTNIGSQTLGFYVKGENGTAYYTTSINVCEHEDTGEGGQLAATCTQIGYTMGIYCNDCDSFISGHEEIPALGHDWSDWEVTTAPTCTVAGVETATCSRCDEEKTQAVAAAGHSYSGVITPPTVTEQGYTTYNCGNCGHSYAGDYTEALGETFLVSFRVPAGIAAVAPMTCTKDGITLPTAEAPEGYSFLGWVTESLETTEAKPEILTGSYNATANVTLHALYSFVETDGETQSGVYTLYSGQLTEGDYVIYYKTDALKATTTSGGRISAQTTTVSGDAITNPDETVVWHIAQTDDGYWTIYNEAANVYAAGTGSKNKATLLTSVTDYAKWTPSGTSAYEFVNKGNKAKGVNANLRWNSTSIGWATYSTSTGGAVSLYKGQTGTTYYTTLTAQAAAEVGGITYETLTAAIAAANGSTVKLLQNGDTAITAEGIVYLDLNGFTAEVNAERLYVMDSTSTTAAVGDGRLVTESEVAVQWGSFVTLDTGDGYSAHKLELQITTVTLRTAKAGIYYKATLNCDPELRANIGACGVVLSVDGGAEVRTRCTGAPTGEFTSGSVFNIFNQRYSAAENADRGETEIYANAYIELLDGTMLIDNGGVAQSLRDVMEYLDSNFASLTAQDQTQVKTFCATWADVLAFWDLQNLI